MKKEIEKILEKAGLQDAEIFEPEHEAQGHCSTNAALRLASAKSGSPPSPGSRLRQGFGGQVGRAGASGGKTARKNPLELAKEIAKKIQAVAPPGFFERVEAAPPGFINFWVSPKAIQEKFAEIIKKGPSFAKAMEGEGKTVIVEYSQPNIAKKMHVGHLRTTIIGDALANVFELLGYKVIRWNYLGDWGTQFGKLIAAYKTWGEKKRIEANPIEELQALYVKFHDELSAKGGSPPSPGFGRAGASGGKNTELDKRGQEEFRKLEEGDAENRKLWEWFKEESLQEFEKAYEILGVKFDTDIGESFYEKDVKSLVARLIKNGIAKESEGAVIVSLDKYGLPPALIQKSDGASLYLARDIANLEYRVKKYKPEKILYVVGNEQSLHFEQLFAVADILGLNAQTELVHVKYGLVLGEEGKKLATREGRTVFLEDVLSKAIQLAREIFEEKEASRAIRLEETVAKKATIDINAIRAGTGAELSDAEREQITKAIGIGALKYGILKENRNTDIVFNWKAMLNLAGDSAPYLQYSYARLRSIVRKSEILNPKSETNSPPKADPPPAEKFKIQNPKIDFGKLNGEAELRLARKIFEFPEEVARSGEILETNNLANYLYELAALASRLYETTPVLKDPDEARRVALLVLIETAAAVLKSGLNLLGIKAPERI